jgi:ectoine hydroxylase
MRFSTAECEQFDRDGYVVREGAFDRAAVAEMRDAIEVVVADVIDRATRPDAGPEARMGDGRRLQFSSQTVIQWEWREGSQEVRLLEPCDHFSDRFSALWDDVRFTDPMRDIVGGDIAPFTSKLNLKRPVEGSQFPWHQDYPYWYVFTPEHAGDVATAMLFLDDATIDNGALRVLPGSHRNGPAPRDPDDPTRFLADPRLIDEDAAHVLEVPAGSVCFFNAYLLHRSSPNTSAAHRRALLFSFQPAGRPRMHALEWRPHLVEELP